MDPYFSYEIDSVRRYVRVTYQRQPDFRQWLAAIEAILRDPAFQPGYGILIDRRAIPHAVTVDYIRNVVRFIEDSDARTGSARWAFLVGDLASFGMARMAEQLSMSDRIRAFRDPVEAERWLAGE